MKKSLGLALSIGGLTVALTALPALSDETSELQPPTLRVPSPHVGEQSTPSTEQGKDANSNTPAPQSEAKNGYFAAPHVELSDKDITQGMIPGVGPETMAQLPSDSQQVIVASSPRASDDSSTVVLYEYTEKGWSRVKSFSSHNGKAGWRENRREGDETTPAGVFSVSDAGGTLKDPGSKLPYTQDSNMSESAVSVYGPEYSGVFDYVIAVDYNRVKGTPPTNQERPMGREKGGGIWLHVDHGKGTHGCVTVTEDDMRWLLRRLDPEKNPHVIFGDTSFIAQ